MTPTTIPPLISGGVMLTYRCTNACRHCLYRCSPRHDKHFMPESMIDATMAALAKETTLHGIHLAGGEATLDWKRLVYAIRSARRHGIAIDCLETNGSWCDDERTAHEGFSRLHEAGLRSVLISVSLFHNEFIPLAKTKTAIRAATEIFGRRGVTVWTLDVLERMNAAKLDEQRTHSLDESSRLLELSWGREALWRLHGYLTPGGRAVEQLAEGLPTWPAESFEGDACGRILENTTHFHIDPLGNLFTGHCPGISVANVGDLHPAIDSTKHAIYCQLAEGGPVWLWRGLAPEFEPDPRGYVSKCHLCLDLRKHLRSTGRYEELRPDEFYRE
ncbi:MAG TPA: radical SAM protein [Thermoguttaceae bacterium]|nr:radical SAM protein [Thermoguttaceae bacterium]